MANYLTPDLHDHIIFCLLRGDSIRKIERETGVARGSIQIRKNMLIQQGYEFRAREHGTGGVRRKSSTVHLQRMRAVMRKYEEGR